MRSSLEIQEVIDTLIVEAEAIGLGLVLVGHFASERFGVERLAKVIADEFDEIEAWASLEERDPLQVV